MATDAIVAVSFFAGAALVIIVAVGLVLVNKSFRLLIKGRERRQLVASRLRGDAKDQLLQARRHQALGDETAAKARATRAEADVKAAQATGLEQQASDHCIDAATSCEELSKKCDLAGTLEPDTKTTRTVTFPQRNR